MQLFNSLSNTKEPFSPQGKSVTLYTCGPTVYDFAHIGNLRTFLFYDVLRRTLRSAGHDVQHVMNITDVGHLTDDADSGEDKMEKGAAREGQTVWDVAQRYTDAFVADARALNIVLPEDDYLPRATDYIEQQIAFVQLLEQRGHTYTISDGVYFDTSTFADYGKMAQLDLDGLQEGARVAANTEKRNASDFALWKLSPEGSKRAMEWDSPWGVGFPGWHLECSVMARELLGDTVDIHAGGVDHKPVHHTNEIAQSESATGQQFARFWLHGEFLLMNEGKMSKSDATFVTLQEIVDRGIDPLAYRFFVLSAHYRSKLNFSWDALDVAQSSVHKLISVAADWEDPTSLNEGRPFVEDFFSAVNDDMNMPEALAVMWALVKSEIPSAQKKDALLRMDTILGFDIERRSSELREKIEAAGDDVRELLAQRDQARKSKDYESADRLRDDIAALGFTVEDTEDGPILKPKKE